MVDASVGGKTGVDLQAGKNLVGRVSPAAGGGRRPRFPGDTAGARAGGGAGRGGQVRLHRRSGDSGAARAERAGAVTPELVLRARGARRPGQGGGGGGGRDRVRPARHPELRPHRRPRAGGGLRVRAAARRGGGAGDGRGAGAGRARWGSDPRALAARARALLARLALPVDLARRLDADVWSRITVDKKRRGSTIRFVLCPEPGETLLRDLTPREIAAGAAAPRKLDPRIPSEYKPKATMASPFRESIEKLLDGIEGGVACVLMGFDGITVDTYAKGGAGGGGGPDIQTLSMEFAHLIAQARRTLESVDAGALEEFTLAHRQADAGRAHADAGVLPGLRHPAGGQPGAGALPDAPDGARPPRRPLKDARLHGQKREQREGAGPGAQGGRRPVGERQRRRRAAIDFESVRALARIATEFDLEEIEVNGAGHLRVRRGGVVREGGAARRARRRRARPIALTPPVEAQAVRGRDLRQLAVRRDLLPSAVARGAVVRRGGADSTQRGRSSASSRR